MDIKEITSRRRQLESDILDLLALFERTVGVKIVAIGFERAGLAPEPNISKVKVTISLND